MPDSTPPGAASDHAADSAADRTVIIERTFDVPARILFLAYSKPEHVKRWFGPPGYPLTLCELDFRVGGRYRFAMTGPDGVQMTPFSGEYLAIVPDQRITYTDTFEEPGAETMTVTILFTEHAGRTTLRMETVFGSLAMKAQHLGMGFEAGVNGGCDQLAQVARELQASASHP